MRAWFSDYAFLLLCLIFVQPHLLHNYSKSCTFILFQALIVVQSKKYEYLIYIRKMYIL